MPVYEVNYLAVLVAAIASMALGALWYSPRLFGKMWMSLMGFTEAHMAEAKKKGMGKSYAIMFVGSLLMAYVLSHWIDATSSSTVGAGFQAGFWAWLGFIAPVTLGSVLWEGKSWKLWVLNNGYQLVLLLIMGALLSVWA